MLLSGTRTYGPSQCCRRNCRLLLPILTSHVIFYVYKSQIKHKMEFCCHFWAGTAQSAHSSHDKVQKSLRILVCNELSSTLWHLLHSWDVAYLSLLYHNIHGKCSDDLHSLVPPSLKFKVRIRHATNIVTKKTIFPPYYIGEK